MKSEGRNQKSERMPKSEGAKLRVCGLDFELRVSLGVSALGFRILIYYS